jgi:hypothetical protein
MAQSRNIISTGISALQALAIGGSTAKGLVATGSTQATALALPADINLIATAAAGTGVIANTMNPGDWILARNNGANACLIYPPVGGTINALALNAGYSVATGASGFLFCVDAATFIGITAV